MGYNNYRRQEPTVGYINLMMFTSPVPCSSGCRKVTPHTVVTEPCRALRRDVGALPVKAPIRLSVASVFLFVKNIPESRENMRKGVDFSENI